MALSRFLDPNAKGLAAGAVWMLVTTFFFVCVHTIGKYLVETYPVAQVVWGRYVFHLVFAMLVLGRRQRQAMRTANLKLQLLRSSFMLGATVFYFAGVRYIPLAEANAISFTTPIFVVMLAPLVLGERVGRRRWLGVAVGFLGALVVVRPGVGGMEAAAALLLACSVSNAGYQITTRILGGRDDSLTTLFYTASVGTLLSSIAVPFAWEPMDGTGWILMVAIGGFACAGHFTLILAYRAAEASAVAPFNYANLLWAAVFGLIVFGDLPDPWTVVGAAMIAGAGLYILRRERREKTAAPSGRL